MHDLPASFTGTSSFTPGVGSITMSPGTNIKTVVSFALLPIGSDENGNRILEPDQGEIKRVCVTNVKAVDPDTIVNFFVLPETALGAIAVLGSIFAAFIGYNYMRKR